MPIDLDRPLPLNPDAAEVAMLGKLQGNVLKGHGRHRTAHVLLRFDPEQSASARAFLRALAARITSADVQLRQARTVRAARSARRAKPPTPVFLGCLLSNSGYHALGVPGSAIPSDPQFRAGMKARGSSLADPEPGTWDKPYRGSVDAMVLIAGEPDKAGAKTCKQVEAALAEVLAATPDAVEVLGIERGRAYLNGNGDGIEHFGYADGRSQPLLRESDIAREAANSDGIVRWNPAFPLKQVLVPDPGANDPTAFGSYFVYRKLEQHVRAFHKAEKDLGRKLHRLNTRFDPELAGAMMVGRFEDGAPVLLQDGAGMHNPLPNDFDYSGDMNGLKCPFHAHIRKANPRGDTARLFGVPLDQERAHIMARRGITYGDRKQNKKGEFTDAPSRGAGLLFMAFQADIGNQFEFTQRSWVNNEDFVHPETGIDPLIGQGTGRGQVARAGWGDSQAKKITVRFAGFVTLKGGEYFFAPSIPFLRTL